MRKGDIQLVNPNVWLAGTKSSIEALTGLDEGAVAWATDTDEPGWYDGVTWDWGLTAVTGSHSDLQDLDQDDHTQYILADGTRDMSLGVGIEWAIKNTASGLDVFSVDEDGNTEIEGHLAVGGSGSLASNTILDVSESMNGVAGSASYGLVFNMDKTAGTTDEDSDQYAMLVNYNMNQTGGVVGNVWGGNVSATLYHGDLGTALAPGDLVGWQNYAYNFSGTVYGDMTAFKTRLNQSSGGTVAGDMYGMYLDLDVDGTVTGTSYGIYVDENATYPPDYCIYQSGTAESYLGGTTTFNRLVDARHIRAFDGGYAPAAGEGLELEYSSGYGYVSAYDRDSSGYTALRLRGLPLELAYQGTPLLRVANGYIEIPTDCDSFRGASTAYPDLGMADLSNAAYKWGNLYLASDRDVFPDADSFGLGDRIVTHGRAFSEHYRAGAEEQSWTGWATYTGFVTPDTLVYQNSCLHMGHSSAPVRAFRYRAHSAGASTHYIHCGVNYQAKCGLMIDDGSDTGDGEGANNFVRVYFLTTGVTTSIDVEYRTGGGSVTTVNYNPQLDPTQMHTLLLYVGYSGTWSYGAYLYGSYQLSKLIRWAGSMTWTPTRVGIYYENASASTQNRGVVDWGYFA